jgi:hypothetical protein
MYELLAKIAVEDKEHEYQLRLQLRDVLTQTLALLTDPNATEWDANRVIALINQTLEETAP